MHERTGSHRPARRLRAPQRTPLALRRAVGENVSLRRLARRLGFVPANARGALPRSPVGVKLELTYRCNLTCPFCYTDSPRRTRERAADLEEEAWLRIVDDAVEAGVIEAVVTGGEPLLRRELALEIIERLAGAGVGVTLNTNGWFVDEDVADRLARVPGLQTNISIDGASPELHDSTRGVRGSWRRAVGAVDLLLRRGARVCVAHVVTPENEAYVADFLDEIWLLGVPALRMTPAAPVGAAARDGVWDVDRRALRHTVDQFKETVGDSTTVRLGSGTIASLATIEDVAPAALLVRPNGSVWINSKEPFSFGNATEEPLATVWNRIRSHWRDPRIVAWADSIRTDAQFVRGELVPYRDAEVQIVPSRPEPASDPAGPRLPRRKAPQAPGAADLQEARRFVRELAFGRRYWVAPVRSVDDDEGGRYVRVLADGRVCRLNRTAALVMDACWAGTPAEAASALAQMPGAEPARVDRDVVTAVRALCDRRILLPAG